MEQSAVETLREIREQFAAMRALLEAERAEVKRLKEQMHKLANLVSRTDAETIAEMYIADWDALRQELAAARAELEAKNG